MLYILACMMKYLKKLPIAPFVLTIYAVLSLWVVNSNQTPFFSIFRTLFFTLVITILILLFFALILQNWPKAGLASSLAIILFLTYGHIFNLLKGKEIFGVVFHQHRYLLAITGVIFIVFLVMILKSKKKSAEANLYVNLISLFLLVISGFQAGSGLIKFDNGNHTSPQNKEVSHSQQIDLMETRDVYYIVMDAYSRQDLLQEEFGFDNSSFLEELTDLGFVIPNCSQSNYEGTQYSLSSSLNINYFDQLGISFSDLPNDPKGEDTIGIIKSNLVVEKFKEMGYKIVTFKSIFPFINLSDSDYYFDAEQFQPFYKKTESINFQDLFFKTTLMRVPIEIQQNFPEKFDFLPDSLLQLINPQAEKFSTREYKLYDQYLFELDKLRELPNLQERKFVYAHLLITHQPFVFNPNGSMRKSLVDNPDAYIDQIRFSNQELIQIVKNIIENSNPQPIIIIQGDHSIVYQGEDRVKILNAYYLPDGGNDQVYPSITPVNTFRLVFNYYFGDDLPMLPDHSYYRETLNSKDATLLEASQSCIK